MINDIIHYYNIGLNSDEINSVTGVPVATIESVIVDNDDLIERKIPSRREAYELVRDGYITVERGATITMFDKIHHFVESYNNWLCRTDTFIY